MVARLTVVVAVVALVACGQVSKRNDSKPSGGGAAASGGGGGSGSTGGTGEIVEPPECPLSSPPEVPLRALGESELKNELALFGQPLDGEVFPEPHSLIYDEEHALDATSQFVAGHADFVHGLAKSVTDDAAGLGNLLGCDVVAAPAKCQAKLFDFVIARLFRGRQSMETVPELQQVFDSGQQLGGNFQSGARAVLEVALQSPEFLYRPELGRPVQDRSVERAADWSQPTDVEMASRLSFLLWDRGPDDELLAAAAEGGLTEPADIEAQARRMLADERARAGVVHFYRDLMRITRDPYLQRQVPEFTSDIVALMDQEFASFVDHATFEGPGDFQALFAPTTWVNGPLASYYGLSGVKGEAFQAVDLDPKNYAGILTQPAWLTRVSSPGFTNPSRRGWVAVGAFLCQDVPPEPPGVNNPDPTPPGMTTRERLTQHVSPACAACHHFIDPPGFALEHIDSTGRYRETEHGFAIDTSGHWAPDGPPFDGAVELGALLAGDQLARDCYVSQWARFAFGRAEELRNSCARSQLVELFSENQNVVELLVALTQTESFRFRKVQP